MTRKKKFGMEIVNHLAAGIDVGSKSHFVAVGQSLEDVKEFGVHAEDLVDLCKWLVSYDIKTVALESTGVYWQNLFIELQKHGLEVVLCNGKFTKHAKGKKTDVKDCRWIQKLYSLGLLTSSFNQMKQQKYFGPIADKEPTGLNWLQVHHEKCRSI